MPPGCGFCVRRWPGRSHAETARRRRPVRPLCAELTRSGAAGQGGHLCPGVPKISARRFPRLSHRGRRGLFYLFIFISLYLIYGFTLDTRESIRVNFKYYLILQTRLLMLAVIRGGPLRGCQMEMRVAACAHEPAISKSPESDTQVRLGTAESKG